MEKSHPSLKIITISFAIISIMVGMSLSSYLLSRFTGIGILGLYGICHATDLLKCIIGAYMLKKGAWIQDLVNS
jgi:Na+-driven multidrug efflux pump